MKKDFAADYVTDAFCMWARHGCRSYDDEIARIEREARDRARYADPAKVDGFVSAEIERQHAVLLDIAACEGTFRLLREAGDEEIVTAVKTVYMATPHHAPHRGEIGRRVLAVAIDTPTSERNVYRWLRKARRLFCELRGIRTY